MSARKDGKAARRGEKRDESTRNKIVPQCKMMWPKMIQFLLDYPGGIARTKPKMDFAGRSNSFYFSIRDGEFQYGYAYDGIYPDFGGGSCASHDFRGQEVFEAFEPKCTCPQCVRVCCCECCKCKQI